MITERQEFLRTRSLGAVYLFCWNCRKEPPRVVGGLCAPCESLAQPPARSFRIARTVEAGS